MKSGMMKKNGDLGDYELAFTWNLGESQTSVYHLYEYKTK